MKSNLTFQLISSALCIFFAAAFLNPLHLLMTDSLHMLILGLLAAAFGALAVLLLLEQGGDEREDAHRAFAGRAGFLIGAAILLCGIVREALAGPVDAWLLIALCGMVAGKALARIYARARF